MENYNYKLPWLPPGGVDLNGNVRGMTLNVAPPMGSMDDGPIDLSCRKDLEGLDRAEKTSESGLRQIGTIIVDNTEVLIKVEKDDEVGLAASLTTNSDNIGEGLTPSQPKLNPVPVGVFCHQNSQKNPAKQPSKGGRKTVEPIIEFLKERSNKRQEVAMTSNNVNPPFVVPLRPDNIQAQIPLNTNQNSILAVDDVEIKTEPIDDDRHALLPPNGAIGNQISAERTQESSQVSKGSKKKKARNSAKQSVSTLPSVNTEIRTGSREESPECFTHFINITPHVETDGSSNNQDLDRGTVCGLNKAKKKRGNSAVNDISNSYDDPHVVRNVQAKLSKSKKRVPPEYRRRKLSLSKKKTKGKKQAAASENLEDFTSVPCYVESQNAPSGAHRTVVSENGDLAKDSKGNKSTSDVRKSKKVTKSVKGKQRNDETNVASKKSPKKKSSTKSPASNEADLSCFPQVSHGTSEVTHAGPVAGMAGCPTAVLGIKGPATKKKTARKSIRQTPAYRQKSGLNVVNVNPVTSEHINVISTSKNLVAKKSTSGKPRKKAIQQPIHADAVPTATEAFQPSEVVSVYCDKEIELQARSLISSSMKKMLPSAKKAGKIAPTMLPETEKSPLEIPTVVSSETIKAPKKAKKKKVPTATLR